MGRLGRVLERLGLLLKPLEAFLERLGASWRRLGASWARLEASGPRHVSVGAKREPSAEAGTQLRLAAGNSQRFTKTLEKLPNLYLYE